MYGGGLNLICMNNVAVIAYDIVKYHMYEKSRGNCVEDG